MPDTMSAETIEAALAEAHIPSLMMALVHLTGDTVLLTPDRRPRAPTIVSPESQLPADDQRLIRAFALDALVEHFARRAPPLPDLAPATLDRMIRYLIGDTAPETYLPFLEQEIGVADMRRPDWSSAPLQAAAANMHAIIVGAGMSGLLAAIRLQQAGIGFTIIEKNPELGGTWYENTYPGCRVDSDNQLYSYSFEPNPDWPQHFSTQATLLDYFRSVADKHDLRRHIRFNCTVTEAHFDAAEAQWTLRFTNQSGEPEVLTGTVFVSAVGQLNVPNVPDIAGLDRFAGPVFHSARWRHNVDLAGKRVAVIGTGASAFQFVPEVAAQAAKLSVFQRHPPWLLPTPHYHDDVSAGQRWLLTHVPFYANWYRFWLYWRTVDGMYHAVQADPDYAGNSGAISAANAQFRAALEAWIGKQVGDSAKLAGHVIPGYPVGGKRGLRDSGRWIAALRRDNVQLVTDAIKEVAADGIVTSDGALHPADVMIFGTGFHASDFLSTIRVTGSGGVDLHESWGGNARAYLGTMVPGFPNMFMLYGPNTNLVINGSIILFAECSVGYMLDCMRMTVESGNRWVDVRQSVYDNYNARIDRQNAKMAWGLPDVSNWYKNALGRVSQNWPFPTVDYWAATQRANPDDFTVGGGAVR